MPGYSGTPLPRKLGFKAGLRVALINVPPDVRAELADALADCQVAKNGKGPLDLVLFATTSQLELTKQFAVWKKNLVSNGALWISWPKRTSGVATDLDGNKVRALGLSVGLVDVKVCAVSEVWSGLKFVVPLKDRPKTEQL